MAIVKMKKMICAARTCDGEALLRRIQQLGVLHPEHIMTETESEKLSKLDHGLHVYATVIRILETRKSYGKNGSYVINKPEVSDVERWANDEKRITEQITHVEREMFRQEVFGDFEPDEVRELEKNGIYIELWSADAKDFKTLNISSGVALKELSRGRTIYFATIGKTGKTQINGATLEDLPKHSLSHYEERKKDLDRQLKAVSTQIDHAVDFLAEFRTTYKKILEERDFYETLDRSFEDENIIIFGGWVPDFESCGIKAEIEKEFGSSAVKFRDSKDDETPPVKTKNNWLARTFEPLMHVLGFPNYRGVDPALFFAPSMMLFFGICLGDAGYGLVMLIIAFFSKKYLSKKVAGMEFVANMTALFGLLTLAWGLITGTIFGIGFKHRGWIALDVSPGVGDPMLLFKISIGIGIIHLSIAFIIAIIGAVKKSEKFLKSGMLLVMWGGALGVLKVPLWWALFGLGAIIILFFSADEKNPLKRVGIGLWNIYGLTSLLGDVMSYARLFGLGVASGAIASVVNLLASDVRNAVPVAGYLLAVLVLLFGHSFNFAMGLIGALVHPARLHAVEAFPKCVELNGKPYKPLEKIHTEV
jgi:V/A-type H+-transporting ATPase subunit I